VREGRASTCSGRKHLRAAVYSDNRSGGTHLINKLRDGETWPAAHVQDPVPRTGTQRVADQRTPPHHVPGAVPEVELLGGILIEDQLAHSRHRAPSAIPAATTSYRCLNRHRDLDLAHFP